jgi:hypothetical protein
VQPQAVKIVLLIASTVGPYRWRALIWPRYWPSDSVATVAGLCKGNDRGELLGFDGLPNADEILAMIQEKNSRAFFIVPKAFYNERHQRDS